ncbi:MAG: DUF4177 domain-containing protein [Clostridia bacterium]|nr:DUF4177 domain-containing protein [Clostridia bacterium]
MKKYEYVSLSIDGWIFGSNCEEHRQIIDAYAEKGYRYVGYIPTHVNTNGRMTDIDLIFKIDTEETR